MYCYSFSLFKDKIESKAKKSTNLRQMDTNDLLALVEAQAPPISTIELPPSQPMSTAIPVATTTTVAAAAMNPGPLPMMSPLVQPQFQGMPPIPSKMIRFLVFHAFHLFLHIGSKTKCSISIAQLGHPRCGY